MQEFEKAIVHVFLYTHGMEGTLESLLNQTVLPKDDRHRHLLLNY